MKKKILKLSLSLMMTLAFITTKSSVTIHATDQMQCKSAPETISTADNTDTASTIMDIFSKKYKVIRNNTKIYSGPGATYSVLGYLNKGDIISISSISNGWAKYKYNSSYGYVSTHNIQKK